jgi:hypothetical protein
LDGPGRVNGFRWFNPNKKELNPSFFYFFYLLIFSQIELKEQAPENNINLLEGLSCAVGTYLMPTVEI